MWPIQIVQLFNFNGILFHFTEYFLIIPEWTTDQRNQQVFNYN